jgi:hypothetical protein
MEHYAHDFSDGANLVNAPLLVARSIEPRRLTAESEDKDKYADEND